MDVADKEAKMAKGTKLNELALGYAGAALAVLCMLLLSIGAKIGIYTSAAEQMMSWHMFYSLSIGGIITGIIEAAVLSFIGLYVFAWVYNKFV